MLLFTLIKKDIIIMLTLGKIILMQKICKKGKLFLLVMLLAIWE